MTSFISFLSEAKTSFDKGLEKTIKWYKNFSSMTPIILLHHNEIDFLEIHYSIIKNTKSRYEIIIVDNKSNKKTLKS